MIILGIDPGSRALGLGLVRSERGRLAHLDSCVIRPPAGSPSGRLAHIYDCLSERLRAWQPHGVAIETVFSARSPRSALLLGQARGVALAACGGVGLECAEYAPAQVKQAVTSSARAEKQQVQAMVQQLLGLSKAPPQDAADALAVAICHAHAGPGAARVAAALARDAAASAPGGSA